MLDLLAELPPASEPDVEPVEAGAEAIATAFLTRLFGDEQLEGLRLRETAARFISVSVDVVYFADPWLTLVYVLAAARQAAKVSRG